jgi:hypothetical protein
MQIIPASLAIKAMRDSGYRDSAHALAELIDNSIQAGAKNVEVICLDKSDTVNQRVRNRVDRIAVYDDGSGMSAATLRIALQFGNGTHLKSKEQTGIGKFGMGLPNSSISQCQKLEVWTWQDGKAVYSYLDVERIQNGELTEVPEPIPAVPPQDIIEKLNATIGLSGTLVLWSKLDRIRWKGSKTLLQNSEFLIGRMYRYFIHDDSVKIRLAALSKGQTGDWIADYDQYAKPNDPMFLMNNTSCPELPDPYSGDAMFEEYGDPVVLAVTLPDDHKVRHNITIRFSIVKPQIRKNLNEQYTNAGSSPPGRYAARNIGISLVRAGRELELSQAHVIGYDPVERWWGAEVSFPPALDGIFGVTNNKQSATAFEVMNEDDDAAELGLGTQEYRQELMDSNDPRWVMYEISRQIHRNLSAIRGQLKRMSDGSRTRQIAQPIIDPAEDAATRATRHRMSEGFEGTSDREEELSKQEKTDHLAQRLTELGNNPEEAMEIAVTHIDSGLKYVFQQLPYQGPSFFSVSSRGGSIIVTVNQEHPVSTYLIGLLEESENVLSDKALLALKLMLCAWARLEDETQNPQLRQRYTDFRDNWGRLTKDFFNVAYDE